MKNVTNLRQMVSFLVMILMISGNIAFVSGQTPVKPSEHSECEKFIGTLTYTVPLQKGYSYQWYSAPYKGDFLPIKGATSNVLTLTFTKEQPLIRDYDRTQFKCEITPLIGRPSFSDIAYLYLLVKPSVTKHPSSATKLVGESVTFSITASGSLPRTYQWQRDVGSGYVNILGATSTSYTIPAVVTGDAGNYRCRVSNACGTVNSSAAVLTVNEPLYEDGWFAQISGTQKNLRQITAVSKNIAWVVTEEKDQLLSTIDGGDTWNTIYMKDASEVALNYYGYCIWFTDANHGFVGGVNGYAYTSNGGTSWSKTDVKTALSLSDNFYTRDICFYNTSIGWIVGDDGLIAKTANGGTTWTKQNWGKDPVKVTDADLKCIYFLDSQKGWIGGVNGVILITTDGGAHWVLQSAPEIQSIIDIHFLTASKGFAVGGSYKDLYYTENSGTNWYKYSESNLPYFYPNSVDFSDINNGWLAGAAYQSSTWIGRIMRTNDGGSTWHIQSVEDPNYLVHMVMVDKDNGWAVGWSGEIQRTANGGCLHPTVNLYADTALCASENYTIVADTFAKNLNCSYLWNTEDTTRKLTVTESGTYSVVVTNLCGENATDSKKVEFYPLPDAYAGEDTSLCIGDTIQLNAAGGVLFSWVPTNTLTDPNIQNPRAFPGKTTTYTVSVTDTNTCVNTDQVKVTVYPIPTSAFSSPAYICGSAQATIKYTGTATPGANYYWDFDEGIVEPSGSSYLVNWDQTGTKNISLVVEENGCTSDTNIKALNVNPVPYSDFEMQGTVCGDDTIIITYLGVDSVGAYYDWDFNNGSIISGINEGPYQVSWATGGTKTVSLEVTQDGCVSELTEKDIVVSYPFEGEEICLVSVDDSTEKNMVIWEKTPDPGIAAYIVYRETNVINVYEPLDTIPYDNLSVYVDETSKPKKKAHLYKISVIDTCGNESLKSWYHKTLFLQYGGFTEGFWMHWGSYEIEGPGEIDFDSYIIYRGSDSTKLQPIDTLSASHDQYTDYDPVVKDFRLYYRIEGVKHQACYPANLSGKKAGTGPYSHSLSNLEDNRLQVGIKDLLDSKYQLRVYPNPFSQGTRISYNLREMSEVKIEVFNLLGARVAAIVKEVQSPGEYNYNLTGADIGSTEGIFYMRFTANGQNLVRKLILTR